MAVLLLPCLILLISNRGDDNGDDNGDGGDGGDDNGTMTTAMTTLGVQSGGDQVGPFETIVRDSKAEAGAVQGNRDLGKGKRIGRKKDTHTHTSSKSIENNNLMYFFSLFYVCKKKSMSSSIITKPQSITRINRHRSIAIIKHQTSNIENETSSPSIINQHQPIRCCGSWCTSPSSPTSVSLPSQAIKWQHGFPTFSPPPTLQTAMAAILTAATTSSQEQQKQPLPQPPLISTIQ
jgi:hypothetical protein